MRCINYKKNFSIIGLVLPCIFCHVVDYKANFTLKSQNLKGINKINIFKLLASLLIKSDIL